MDLPLLLSAFAFVFSVISFLLNRRHAIRLFQAANLADFSFDLIVATAKSIPDATGFRYAVPGYTDDPIAFLVWQRRTASRPHSVTANLVLASGLRRIVVAHIALDALATSDGVEGGTAIPVNLSQLLVRLHAKTFHALPHDGSSFIPIGGVKVAERGLKPRTLLILDITWSASIFGSLTTRRRKAVTFEPSTFDSHLVTSWTFRRVSGWRPAWRPRSIRPTTADSAVAA